jgi:hypothetical protein
MGSKLKLEGRVFNRLTVLSEAPCGKQGLSMWLCVCTCQKQVVVAGRQLTSGGTKSCGCLQRETVGRMRRTHGASKTPVYNVWCTMRMRCANQTDKSFSHYGGRGIKVCVAWDRSFETFAYDMGPRPKGGTLERIDNDKGYEPKNCRWASAAEQCRNQRSNVMVEHAGCRMCVTDWARALGLHPATVFNRIYRGIPAITALGLN